MVLHLHETALDDMGFSIDLDSHIGRMTFAPPSEIDVNKRSSTRSAIKVRPFVLILLHKPLTLE
jgi:hypothetical protein